MAMTNEEKPVETTRIVMPPTEPDPIKVSRIWLMEILQQDTLEADLAQARVEAIRHSKGRQG